MEFFTLNNVRNIKRLGYTLLIGQLLSPLVQLCLSAVTTWHNAPGQRELSIGLSGTNITIILSAILVILISWIMTEGYKMNEERKHTI